MTKIRECTVPLNIETIKEYFVDKEILFLIDYDESKLKDKVFLTYLANLDLPCDIKATPDFDKEKMFALLDAYMEVKTVTNVPFLAKLMSHILLKAIGFDTDKHLTKKYFSEEIAAEFIETRKEAIKKWVHFLDSSMLFLIYSTKELNEQLKVEENFPVIDDADYIGLNIVNLFTLPGFLTCYLGQNPTGEMSFFKQQFEKHMFKGKSFFEYFNNGENITVPLMLGLIDGKIPHDPREVFAK